MSCRFLMRDVGSLKPGSVNACSEIAKTAHLYSRLEPGAFGEKFPKRAEISEKRKANSFATSECVRHALRTQAVNSTREKF